MTFDGSRLCERAVLLLDEVRRVCRDKEIRNFALTVLPPIIISRTVMTRRMKLAIISLLLSTALVAQKRFDPVPGGFVSGDARIRLLSPTLLRLEYSPSRAFADSPSAVVLKRDWNPPEVSLSMESGWIVLSSKGMTVRYRTGPGRFHEREPLCPVECRIT